jgi:hypothetical protein
MVAAPLPPSLGGFQGPCGNSYKASSKKKILDINQVEKGLKIGFH